MKKHIVGYFIYIVFLPFPSIAQNIEGINLDLTRVILDSQQKSTSIKVNNFNNKTWLLRSWISEYNSDEKNKSFILTPPLYRVSPGESIQLRIDKISQSLPMDKESVFIINVLAIPAIQKDNSTTSQDSTKLQLAINNRIKLFYRPHNLNKQNIVDAAFKSLKISKNQNNVQIKNPTPYYITMDDVKINGKKVTSIEDFMVAPYSTLNIPERNAISFSFTTINDYGGKSSVTVINF
ncbi:molecular chaperone [Escherichia sp. MOD1-EC5495]|uniref:fimbrial biogenesis chaperone n=1 Tax=Escherichia sp. MOD1-EC5495 TaxID=2093876 RepID=UPI000CF797BA|nr:molecular chaperone [Escherichia sp. MOD1-EC5495]